MNLVWGEGSNSIHNSAFSRDVTEQHLLREWGKVFVKRVGVGVALMLQCGRDGLKCPSTSQMSKLPHPDILTQ